MKRVSVGLLAAVVAAVLLVALRAGDEPQLTIQQKLEIRDLQVQVYRLDKNIQAAQEQLAGLRQKRNAKITSLTPEGYRMTNDLNLVKKPKPEETP